jgi:hypothetical protein
VENTISLHELATQYLKSNKIKTTQIEKKYGAASYLTFAFMRQFNPKYQDRFWALTAGLLDDTTLTMYFGGKKVTDIKTQPGGASFMQFVKNQNPSLYDYFQAFGIDGINGFGEKVSHMATALMANMFRTTWGNWTGKYQGKVDAPISILSAALMTEKEYDELASWAGDVQKIGLSMYEHPGADSGDYQYYYDTVTQGFNTGKLFKDGDFQYPSQCQIADADATNLASALANKKSDADFASALKDYYLGDAFAHKFSLLIKNEKMTKSSIEKYAAKEYRTPELIKFTWSLYSAVKRDVPDSQAKGIADAFYDHYANADATL